MYNKKNGGFSLIEVLLSIVILAAVVIPTCTSMVMSYRLNAKSEQMLQAQLAVSSAVEKLMATGITGDFVQALDDTKSDEDGFAPSPEFDGLLFKITLPEGEKYYEITVMDSEGLVKVSTAIRKAVTGS